MPHRLLPHPWLIGIGLTALVVMAYYYGALDVLELRTLDLRLQLRGPLPLLLPIVIVSIDQDSFDELVLLWPWPRTLHAEMSDGRNCRACSQAARASQRGFMASYTRP